jgi:hypothetical protein
MIQGAYRELAEETGINLKANTLLPLSNLKVVSPEYSVQAFYYKCLDKISTSMKEDPDGEVYRWRWVNISEGLPEEIYSNLHVPIGKNILLQALQLDQVKKSKIVKISKADKMSQIVYGVVLAPDEVDFQDDYMTAKDIEASAHQYLIRSRIVGKQHTDAADASVVESYIAPQDLKFEGQNGPQEVKKGSWVMGVKITDPKIWEEVLNGEITGFSVGGRGERE